MQIGLQTNLNSKPLVYQMSKEKIDILLKFIDTFADEKIDENNEDYKNFLVEEINKNKKSKRVASGNSLREII
jgi:hypothetical protein